MELVRVAGATTNQTPVDWVNNAKNIIRLLNLAEVQKIDIVCFPELSISGYGCEDLFASPNTVRMAEQTLAQILSATRNKIVILGMPWLHRNHMYNCAVVIQNGTILGMNPKRLLAREGVHYEQRWFSPWAFGDVEETSILGQSVPFGDLRYQFGTVGMAVEICEEAWGGESSCIDHVNSGVELIVNPSASHFALGKMAVRESLVTNWSRALKVNYVYTNLLGLEAGRLLYDGGVIIAEAGNVVARGPRFGFGDGALTYFDFDMELVRVARLRSRSVGDSDAKKFSPTQAVIGGKLRNSQSRSDSEHMVPSQTGSRESVGVPSINVVDVRFEEFLRCEMLGLFDYLRKTQSNGFVVSLSGGCDSSSIVVMIAHMLTEALRELGPKELATKLGNSNLEALGIDPQKWVAQILTCIYQATENSGPQTHASAKTLAEAIGAKFLDASVSSAVGFYSQEFTRITGRKLNWQSDDIALQNIQARARAPLAWLVANVNRAILLTTSNRSEVAVGYATMDGDTAGGLAPIAGIDKKFLREFLRWLETQTKCGLGALPVLALVNAMAPTAELRPIGAEQVDEKDLMPYEVLERIERLFVRDKMGPEEILRSLSSEFKTYEVPELRAWVSKFLQLWRNSQWKRERFAPAFHIDDESLDPKTWCRFPIISGDLNLSQVPDLTTHIK